MTTKTDAETLEIINKSFNAMMDTVECIIDPFNPIRAMIVSGAAGVGKSYNLIQRLEAAQDNMECSYHKISGKITPLGLYKVLHESSHLGSVLLLDDADVFSEEGTLDLLKAALDSSKTRTVSYITNSPALTKEGIPNQIEYFGKIIFITNKNFAKVLKGTSKMKEHVRALITRGSFIDLHLHDNRSIMLQIEQVMNKSNIMTQYGLSTEQCNDALMFMKNNVQRLMEPSLRMAVEIAGFMLMYPERWRNLAEVNCLWPE